MSNKQKLAGLPDEPTKTTRVARQHRQKLAGLPDDTGKNYQGCQTTQAKTSRVAK